jgi:hypothetical protein
VGQQEVVLAEMAEPLELMFTVRDPDSLSNNLAAMED